jgi:hypothetical protein
MNSRPTYSPLFPGNRQYPADRPAGAARSAARPGQIPCRTQGGIPPAGTGNLASVAGKREQIRDGGPIRVGVVGAAVFGVLLGTAFGLSTYYGLWYGQWQTEPMVDAMIGGVFAILGFLRAYFKGVPFPRRWM